MTAVDWSRYRKCPVCFAKIGEPCLSQSGLTIGGQAAIPLDTPHFRRELRAGAS